MWEQTLQSAVHPFRTEGCTQVLPLTLSFLLQVIIAGVIELKKKKKRMGEVREGEAWVEKNTKQ